MRGLRATALLFAALAACAPSVKPPTADHYLRVAPWTACFDTEHGIRYYAVAPATCPDPIDVERTVRRTMQNVGAELEDVWGTRVVFVPTLIWCADADWPGCTEVSEIGADVLVTQRPGDWTSCRHELGHVIRFRRTLRATGRGDGDGAHRSCDFWRRLENRDCGAWK